MVVPKLRVVALAAPLVIAVLFARPLAYQIVDWYADFTAQPESSHVARWLVDERLRDALNYVGDHPDDANAYVSLAFCYEDRSALYGRGAFNKDPGDVEMEFSCFDTAIFKRPGVGEYYIDAARAAMLHRDPQKINRYISEGMLRINPDNVAYRELLRIRTETSAVLTDYRH